MRGNFDSRMHTACGCATNHQRDLTAAKIFVALHFARHVGHLFEARRDQTREANDISLFGFGARQDFGSGHHHAHVDDFEVIALKHHSDDVFTNIVHITLDGGDHDFAFCTYVTTGRLDELFFSFNKRYQMPDGLLHDAGRFHHLRQKHFSFAKQIAHDVHAIHQRAFDHLDRAPVSIGNLLTDFFGIFDNKLRHAMHHGMGQTLIHRLLTPRKIFFALNAVAFKVFGKFDQALSWRARIVWIFFAQRLSFIHDQAPRLQPAHATQGRCWHTRPIGPR